MTRNIDELNNLGIRAVDPKKFFGEMELSEKQKKERIAFTEKANMIFDFILVLLLSLNEEDIIMFESVRDRMEREYISLVNEFVETDEYLIQYISDFVFDFIDTTRNHIAEEWYYSQDRALFNAENCANDVLNYSDYKNAIKEGKTKKTWITEKDNRVRLTHREVDNKTIPIIDYFYVGGVPMRFPKDMELAEGAPQETINCRCSIKYTE